MMMMMMMMTTPEVHASVPAYVRWCQFSLPCRYDEGGADADDADETLALVLGLITHHHQSPVCGG